MGAPELMSVEAVLAVQIESSCGLGELRYEPASKRIRAVLDGDMVVDTARALLVWEPRRIVPSHASGSTSPVDGERSERPITPWSSRLGI